MSIVEQGAVAPSGRLIAWTAYGLSIVSMALPIFARGRYRDELAIAALALPPVIFVLMLCAPEAFTAHTRYTHKLTINMMPVVAILGFWVSGESHLLDWRPVLAPAGLCAAITLLLGVGLVGSRWPGGLAVAALMMALFGGGYGSGAMIFADRTFDHGPGQTYAAVVQREYVSRGRHTTRHLVLGPWGGQTGETDASVSSGVYDALQPGQTACVTEHPGALAMPWFTTGLCNGV
jgi:hypothetical protein